MPALTDSIMASVPVEDHVAEIDVSKPVPAAELDVDLVGVDVDTAMSYLMGGIARRPRRCPDCGTRTAPGFDAPVDRELAYGLTRCRLPPSW